MKFTGTLEVLKNLCEVYVEDHVNHDILKMISDIYDIEKTFKKHGYKDYLMFNNNHYKYLIAFIDEYMPAYPLEIGTQVGASAACLLSVADYVDFKLRIADVNKTEISEKILNDPRVDFYHCEDKNSCVYMDFSKHDFIFVDIGHDGIVEWKIHQMLVNTKWKGVVFWDDIKLDHRMEVFWKKIENQKIETNWHDDCGFGIVLYE